MALLEDYDFQQRGGTGSHRTFRLELGKDEQKRSWNITLVEPHGGKNQVNRFYVRDVLNTLDEINQYRQALEAQENEEDGDKE